MARVRYLGIRILKPSKITSGYILHNHKSFARFILRCCNMIRFYPSISSCLLCCFYELNWMNSITFLYSTHSLVSMYLHSKNTKNKRHESFLYVYVDFSYISLEALRCQIHSTHILRQLRSRCSMDKNRVFTVVVGLTRLNL